MLTAKEVTIGAEWKDTGIVEEIVDYDARYGDGHYYVFLIRRPTSAMVAKGFYAHDVVEEYIVTSKDTESSTDTSAPNEPTGIQGA